MLHQHMESEKTAQDKLHFTSTHSQTPSFEPNLPCAQVISLILTQFCQRLFANTPQSDRIQHRIMSNF